MSTETGCKIAVLVIMLLIIFFFIIFSTAFTIKQQKYRNKDEDIAVDIMSSPNDKNVKCKQLIHLFAARSAWYILGVWAGGFSIIFTVIALGILFACRVPMCNIDSALIIACLFSIMFLLLWFLLYKYRGHVVYHTFNPQRKIREAREKREKKEEEEKKRSGEM